MEPAPAARLRALLARTRNADGGWPYVAGRASRLEPTCWALLALDDDDRAPLARWQRQDGLVADPGTGLVNVAANGLAALTWQAAAPQAEGVARLVDALLVTRGVPVDDDPRIEQDGALRAWPWTVDTFSWVEPTAWCLLAVKRIARGPRWPAAAARIDEAERVLADRSCVGGGWNYGNRRVYATALPAHVPPTALALLALQDLADLAIVRDARASLEARALAEGSSLALALATLALRAYRHDTRAVAAAMTARAPVAEAMGNLAVVATLLVALTSEAHGALPAALALGARP